ncbi:MAG: CTP synthase [Chloroflexi bacterium]|nr:CTP synthase [Chloroflexota bacterium]
MTKYIFVTGGVVSSVGKGISVASLGRILKSRGVTVSVLKLDPYLNVDPGTMSPFQHGEVFVTKDGCETDLDLGHYERFIDLDLTRSSNLTAGQIYSDIISRERKGEFLGGTIQAIPHVTDAIKERIRGLAEESQAEVIIVEVGGTVGDIEGLPFLEAIRQMRNEVGRDNVFYIHVTFLPYISATDELKSKPTQHSVRELRSIGIQPDAIICRSDHEMSEEIKRKITVHCDVAARGVITLPTVDTVYEVPLILEEEGLGDLIVETLNIQTNGRDMVEWRRMVNDLKAPKQVLSIAVVGKYVNLRDSYISVKEALIHAGLAHDCDVEVKWINSEDVEEFGPDEFLKSVQGIVVPGGFGSRGVEGMIETVRYARNHGVPYLGLCLGLQVMVIDVARALLGRKDANTTECDPDTPDPVIDIMPDQKDVTQKGGTMRLGVYPCDVVKGSLASRAYGEPRVYERHRHRFEFNNSYKEEFEAAGLWPTGLSPDGNLVEIMEMVGQPFMLGTQFHPEFLSRPDRPHPLFREFIGAAKRTLREGGQHAMPLEETDSIVDMKKV